MGIALYILISYLVSVLIYAIVVRNNATNKNSPNAKVWHFLKEGAIGMGIGFLITGAIIVGILLYYNFIY